MAWSHNPKLKTDIISHSGQGWSLAGFFVPATVRTANKSNDAGIIKRRAKYGLAHAVIFVLYFQLWPLDGWAVGWADQWSGALGSGQTRQRAAIFIRRPSGLIHWGLLDTFAQRVEFNFPRVRIWPASKIPSAIGEDGRIGARTCLSSKGECKIKSGVRLSPRLPVRLPVATDHRHRRRAGVRGRVIHLGVQLGSDHSGHRSRWLVGRDARLPTLRGGHPGRRALPSGKMSAPGSSSACALAPSPNPLV